MATSSGGFWLVTRLLELEVARSGLSSRRWRVWVSEPFKCSSWASSSFCCWIDCFRLAFNSWICSRSWLHSLFVWVLRIAESFLETCRAVRWKRLFWRFGWTPWANVAFISDATRSSTFLALWTSISDSVTQSTYDRIASTSDRLIPVCLPVHPCWPSPLLVSLGVFWSSSLGIGERALQMHPRRYGVPSTDRVLYLWFHQSVLCLNASVKMVCHAYLQFFWLRAD